MATNSITTDLLLSILSMDAYSRGYNPGIATLSAAPPGTKVGDATINAVHRRQTPMVRDCSAYDDRLWPAVLSAPSNPREGVGMEQTG